jgi:hypothetical protein
LESVESPIAEQSILLDNTDMSSDVYYMNQLRDIFKDTGLSSIAIELPKKKCLRLVSIWPREEDQESSSLAIYKPAVDLNIIELEYARSGEVGDRIYLFLQLKVPIQVASSRGNAVPEMLTAMLAAVQLQERKLWQNSFSVGFGLPYSQRVMFRNWARTIRNEDADEAWFAVGGEELVVKLTRMELKDGWLGKCRITEFGPQHRHRLPKSRTRDAAGLTWFEPLVKENADL